MHLRRLITFLLGIWFALLLTVAGVATTSFHVSKQLADAPPAEAARPLSSVNPEFTKELFHYLAAEINRTLFEYSGRFEIAILFAIAAMVFIRDYHRGATILAGLMLLTALAAHLLLTPQIVSQGRILDFRGAEALIADRARFGRLHGLFGAFTLFRMAAGAWLAFLLVRRGSSERVRWNRRKTDAVDNPENSHINR